jgi:MoaA/NifB/PqqE/SkfB family radical SAM enzyme
LYKVLHVEPTDVCQAACPLCARETDAEFDKNQKHHLTVGQVQDKFTEDVIASLDKIFTCGNYGDPAAGTNTLELYDYFRKVNPTITLGMNTNGGIRGRWWWNQLGRRFDQEKDYCVFSIDGLEDTNHIYRKNVNWSSVMFNAQAFIDAGGSAHWDMLVYKHNEHQVDACEQLARDMGFTWFRAKVSKRPFTNGVEMPVFWPQVKFRPGSITCHALEEKSIYIDAQGRVSPCCWLGARQTNFVTDFTEIVRSWDTGKPNPVCVETCTQNQNQTAFTGQWQRNKALC